MQAVQGEQTVSWPMEAAHVVVALPGWQSASVHLVSSPLAKQLLQALQSEFWMAVQRLRRNCELVHAEHAEHASVCFAAA